MYQGTVKGSDPGQTAAQKPGATPVASDMSAGHAPLHERLAAQQLRIKQLEHERDDLEFFSHALAHDLRSPVSAVDGFAALLQDCLQPLPGPAGEQARHLATRVRAGVEQIGELIEALQRLSGVSRAPMQRGPVDLSEMAEQLLDHLRQQHPEPPIDACIEPGLRAHADRRLLRQLLANLLGNARKFSSRSQRIRIEFGRLPPGGPTDPAGWGGAFFVRDHGVGFAMDQAQRLFEPHQRLPGSEPFEGQGLGLAIVQRIVSRHGGRLRAESAPEQGATFFFTLGPCEPPETPPPTKA
jgi:signal transduction histidine kinase